MGSASSKSHKSSNKKHTNKKNHVSVRSANTNSTKSTSNNKVERKPRIIVARTITKSNSPYDGLTNSEIIELMEADRDVPDRSIQDFHSWAKVVYVYDGDTCHIVIKYQGQLTRLKCRVYGIDTPEIRSKNPKEKEFAILARDRFIELTKDRLIWVNIMNNDDKYGRYLVSFFLDSEEIQSIANILIKEGYGYAYFGGTKQAAEDWID